MFYAKYRCYYIFMVSSVFHNFNNRQTNIPIEGQTNSITPTFFAYFTVTYSFSFSYEYFTAAVTHPALYSLNT